MKAKARRVAWQSWGGRRDYIRDPASWDERARKAERWADHLQGCSCMGCGNPRKWFGDATRQEDEFRLSAGEQEDAVKQGENH